MWTTTESGSSGSNASFVMRVISRRLESKFEPLDARLPHQHEVGRRHQLDLAGVGVEGVLARHQRIAPDAAAAGLDQLAVRVLGAREVLAPAAGVRDDDADEADRDHRLPDQLDGREQAVDVVRALDEHALLAAAPAARGEEGLGLLERVVAIADVGGEQVVARQCRAVVHGDHREQVGFGALAGAADDHRREGAALVEHLAHLVVVGLLLFVERHRVGRLFGHDDEERRIDDVRAFAQHLALRALLAAAGEEGAHVAEVADRGVVGERLAGRQVAAIAREHVADLALRHRDHRADVDAVLERREEVEAAAAHVGLEARFAAEREQARLHRAARAPELFDDADPRVRDVAHDVRGVDEERQQQHTACRGRRASSDHESLAKKIAEHAVQLSC